MKIRKRAVLSLAAAGWSTMACAQTATAAEASAAPSMSQSSGQAAAASKQDVDEIIVTAFKRDQNALLVPATITVVPSTVIAGRNIVNANELNGIVPGLVQIPGTNGLPATTFRGLGSTTAVFSLEQSVAEYIDGVYLGHSRDYVTPLYDVDHVEFIKGTQSTLLGKNTSLGAVSIVNRRPTKEFGYELQVSHGFGIDGNKGLAIINAPLASTLQARVALFGSEDNGYNYNSYRHRNEVISKELSGRLSLAWQPTSSVDTVFVYQYDKRRNRGQNLEVLSDPGGVIAGRSAALGVPISVVPDGTHANGSDALGGTVAGPDQFDRQDSNRLNFIANWHLDDYTITSQTAYVNWWSPRSNDYDFTPANLFNLTDKERNSVFSQELRLSSPADRRFTHLVGLYYYKNVYRYYRNYLGSPSNTIGYAQTGNAAGSFREPTTAYSAFGSFGLEIVQNVKVEAGARYTHEEKSGTFERTSTGTLAAPYPTVPFTQYATQKTNPLDYNASLQYTPISALLLYGSFSKGSKSGGYQEYPGIPAAAPYRPETAYTAEIGAKWRMDGGDYATLALYHTHLQGFQNAQATLIGGGIQTVIGNANVRSQGFEASTLFHLSSSFTVGGNLVYSSTKFLDDFPSTTAAIAHKGDPLTRVAKWSGKIDVDYTHEVTPSIDLFTGATLNFASKTLLQFVSSPDAPFQKARQLLDAHVGIRDDQAGWELALLASNLTDQRFVAFTTPLPAGGTGIGGRAFYGSLNQPRVVSVQLTLKH